MKANELVSLFAKLMQIDVAAVASVAAIPLSNLAAWLGGKKDNLRMASVIQLLALVGLVVRNGTLVLDPRRVHFLKIQDGLLNRNAYDPLVTICRMFKGMELTRVEPVKQGWWESRTRQIYLLSGPTARIVITLRKSIFKRSHINPEALSGTSWREQTPGMPLRQRYADHSISASAEKWKLLAECDLAVFEFDQIFDQDEPTIQWSDVALMAREYGVTPDAMRGLLLKEHDPQAYEASMRGGRPADGMDMESGVHNLIVYEEGRFGRRNAA